MNKSVFFTGAGGQGKTTTANLLSPIIKLPVVDGLSRGNPYPMGSDEGQYWLEETVWYECMSPELRIHCRTPIDVYAYSKAYGTCSLDDMIYFMEAWLVKKPKIVYFPYLFKIEDDGFRPTDDTLAMTVDSLILEALDMYSIRNSSRIHIASNSVPEQRVKEIIEFLS